MALTRPSFRSATLVAGVLAASVLHAQAPAAPRPTKVVGGDHMLVLMSDGTVIGWGPFTDGQLGPVAAITGRKGQTTGPVAISLPSKAVDVAAGSGTSFAVLEDGRVMTWGHTTTGQMGLGRTTTSSETPVAISGLTDIIQIEAGGGVGVALRKDGAVFAWGPRGQGMIGDGRHPHRYLEEGPPAPSPVQVPGVANVAQISAGGGHVLALTRDGQVIAWGSNWYGALGREPRQELPMDAAAPVAGLTDVVAVAAGAGVSTVVKRDGTAWVWGANYMAQFGNGDRTDPPGVGYGYELKPQPVPGIRNVAAVSLGIGGRHTLALLKDGTLRGWGNTDWGQIGAGVAGTFQERPVIPKLTGVKAVFAVGNNSFAVQADGSFWGWGSGEPGTWPLAANTKLPARIVLK